MSDTPPLAIPARYERVRCLGSGGGGEVWEVRDRLSDRHLALKLLAEDAGEPEVQALVREAVTLSGLEGLGVPVVVDFGRLPGSARPYLVREIVDGESMDRVLDDAGGTPWLPALVRATEQLTALHRVGLLHGDLKPANVILTADGGAALVDLGLAAPWREGGTRARGLTPRFAAPELLRGEPLTVRAEIYALGASLLDGLARRGHELDDRTRAALEAVGAQATAADPSRRYPSADELASALRSATGMAPSTFGGAEAWPIVGLDGPASALATALRALGPGDAIAIEGPAGSGRSTLLRRSAWSTAVGGTETAWVAPPSAADIDDASAVALVLDALDEGRLDRAVLFVDDLERFGADARARVAAASRAGARLVAVGSATLVRSLARGATTAFARRGLATDVAEELVRRALPSLPASLVPYLLERTGARPGDLRAFVARAGALPVVSQADVDDVLASSDDSGRRPRASIAPTPQDAVEAALDEGLFAEASRLLDELPPARSPAERARRLLATARIALARGDVASAERALDEGQPLDPERAIRWEVLRARAAVRSARFEEARDRTRPLLDPRSSDATVADATAVHGVALAYLGDDDAAIPVLEEAVVIAQRCESSRAEAVALGSLAIAHQRAGRTADAKATYERALAAAERARDAWTIGTTHLNLAVLAQGEGDLARAIKHLEASVDLGRRAGALVSVQQAQLNLANLDVHLGRYSRAASLIAELAAHRDALPAAAQPQLLGLEAELAMRTGKLDDAALLHDARARAYEGENRPLDAAEAELEAILCRAQLLRLRTPPLSAASPEELGPLAQALDDLTARRGSSGFGEHSALANIVRGTLLLMSGDESGAKDALDAAHREAVATGRTEWAWRALEARARLAWSQGNLASAHRDTELALAILEEGAARLPRDLREVFWNDPRRRALREAHAASLGRAGTSDEGIAETLMASTSSHLAGYRTRTSSLGASLPSDDKLARIFEITREIARERDLGRLLEHVTDHAVALLGADRGLIVLVGASGEVEVHTARGARGAEGIVAFSRSVADQVLATGEPVVATSALEDARLAHAASVHHHSIQSIACVAIRGAPPAATPIGALYLETRKRPGHRFRAELPTLAAFADQAAIAIESARLLEENRQRTLELERTNEELRAAKEKLESVLDRRTEQLAITRANLREARAELRSHFGYGGLVGTSDAMRRLYALIDRVKDTDIPVLITGESGTGKEVVAKAIHQQGRRAKAPFIGLNCGAIPANLLESELFGHVRGAFTGADRDRKGLFREAGEGTILLDEIGEMPLKMQAGLLRVLQERSVRPVGGTHEEPTQARVVAATNRSLEQMVAEGTFREDLYYRLHVVELRIPPLRERSGDVPALADHFLGIFAKQHKRERKALTREASAALVRYPWPGNVRQLEHVLLNAWLMSDADEIDVGDVHIPDSEPFAPPSPRPRTPSMVPDAKAARTEEEFRADERDRILRALQDTSWNRVRAAEALGMPRRTFYRRLKEYGIL